MKIEFDPNKSLKNSKERGLSFQLAEYFEIETVVIRIREKEKYNHPKL